MLVGELRGWAGGNGAGAHGAGAGGVQQLGWCHAWRSQGYGVGDTPVVWLLPSSACTVWGLCLSFCPPPGSILGGGKRLGGETRGTADPNWPKEYSVPCDMLLSKGLVIPG